MNGKGAARGFSIQVTQNPGQMNGKGAALGFSVQVTQIQGEMVAETGWPPIPQASWLTS